MTYIFFKEEPVNSYYEMKHHIILDDDEGYPLELNYHIYTESHDINTFDSTLESAFKLKIYNEPSTAINTSEKQRYDRLQLFHKIFIRQIKDYVAVKENYNRTESIPPQYQILNLLPYQLSLNVSADKEFKNLFVIIPYEKVIKQNIFSRGNFRVEIIYDNYEEVTEEFIDKNQNDYFFYIDKYQIYSANQMRVLLDDKKDEDNSVHKIKPLFR